MLRSLAQVLLPGRCPGCGGTGEPVCATCALGLHHAPPASAPPGVDDLTSVFSYEGVVRELVARAKYRDQRSVLPWLGAEIARALGDRDFDVVTWVPTTTARRRARGFDQAEILARSVARARGWPARRLLRRLAGPPQTGAPRASRLRGPRFVGCGRAVGLDVLVVDDVLTTGATIAAASRTVRDRGAATVQAAVAARTL